jgi:hypothetical protein
MAQAPSRKRASPAPAGFARGRNENVLPPLRVTYYRQMRRQRVYQATVSWYKGSTMRPPSGVEPIRVRLIMAGAQIVPSEQVLDPSDPDATVRFYVTPLADGKLRAEHLEVLIQGRKVQEVLLPARVVNQRRTWMMLLMAVLMPWMIFTYVRPPAAAEMIPYEANEINLPKYVTNRVPQLPGMLKDASYYATAALQSLHDQVKSDLLEVYWCAGFLLLTLLSWWMRLSKRKRRVGNPIPLPRPAELP